MCNCNSSNPPPDRTNRQNIIKRLWENSQSVEKRVTVKKINKL
jgi:hypothetical protein